MVENKGSDRIFNWGIILLAFIFATITILPLLHVLASSFSSPSAVNAGRVGLLPIDFTFVSYQTVFQEDAIIRGFLNTIMYTVIGTIIQLTLQFTAAYALTRKDLKFKKFWNLFFIIPMFVSGGLIPTYLVVNALGMINTIWAMIIPGVVNLFNIIIIRTYIKSTIPWEMQESAMIDGATNWKIFLKIVLPLCKPIIAVMALYAIIGFWNAYFNSLIYITDDSLFPLQRVLQRFLISNDSGTIGGGGSEIMAQSLKYSTIVIASAPMLFLYPFFQRFFEKGLMVGSVKG
ncbi:MAG: carbohydrate ABC transporter permease [Acholeplasmataceae bacterium]